MPPPMRSVFSSHVDRVGHDAQTGELFVQWDTGKTSVYTGVPAGSGRGCHVILECRVRANDADKRHVRAEQVSRWLNTN